MNLHNPASVSEILSEYLCDYDLHELTGQDTIKKILDGAKLDDESVSILSSNFGTSKEFWINIQKQYEENKE